MALDKYRLEKGYIRKPGGHRWIINEDGDVDIFAADLSSEYCNGPKCEDCGFEACHHCSPDIYDDPCHG